MLKFFKGVLATIVGLFIFSLLFILLGVAIISAASSAEEEVEVAENSVLHLELNKPIVERETGFPVNPFEVLSGGEGGVIGLVEVLEAINYAREDEKIKGIYLEAQNVQAGFATLKEIRDALEDFKSSGKWILAYNELYTEKDYYLASVANEVYLNPAGALELNGLVQEVMFLKGALNKLGVEPQVFRVGEFKSAIEPFTRTDMSEASRLQTNAFLNNIYSVFLLDVARDRGIEADELERISDEMLVRDPEDALELEIVDQLGYYDEVLAAMRLKLEMEDEEEEINLVKYAKYQKSVKDEEVSSDRIAVIVATGPIVSGEGDNESIGSDKFAKAIRDARKNERVKAIVLRINSPGGSALASDVIWREVVLTKGVKPIIASMSDVAASGGYYMAMACDTIVAQPNTITGSIGIFGVIFNMQTLLNDKLGITTDVVETGELSNLYKVTAPLSEFEAAIIQNSVEDGYETFTRKAAEGRDMPLEVLLEVASGRVWSGIEAKDRGLVDVLGSFEDAVQIAAVKAGLEEDDYRLRFYPEKKTIMEELLEGLNESVEAKIMESRLGELYPFVKEIQELKKYSGIQARLPYELVIE
ncbi:signal peptide peptidase SppA [Nafulsella turpanensis]|uniref:signal peptide peptidase SppA n=1 Tax=Nafulsella turpanensis TaxID=1265690 RepID=UPI00034D941D|nr:signal peptide peptidase SppA [Nafulsella turpanensis]